MKKNLWIKGILIGVLCSMAVPSVEAFASKIDTDEFSVMTIDESTLSVDVDGETESFPEEYQVSKKRAKNILSSEESLESYMNSTYDNHIYEATETSDGIYEVTAPYQKKEIVVPYEYVDTVLSTDTKEDLGIKSYDIDTDSKTGNAVVSFDTEEETREALAALRDAYGEESCCSNEVLYTKTLEEESTEDSFEAVLSSYGSASWGNSYMGMNLLKSVDVPAGYNRQVLVAVLDTGVDSSCDLFNGDRISSESYNFLSGNSNIRDTYGHGTHVCGIIADATPGNVKILALKVLNQDGYTTVNAVLNALAYAINKNVASINLSLSFSSSNSGTTKAINSMISKAYVKGIPVCVAAGNESRNVSTLFPASNTKTFAVAAIDSNGERAYFSNYGKGIDFCAPGVEIESAGLGGGYATMSGTSMAAPHIAAAAAYVKMLQPNLSVNGVRNELIHLSRDLGSTGFDNYYGYGCPVMDTLYSEGIIYSGDVATPTLTNIYNTAKGIRLKWIGTTGASQYYIYKKTGSGSYKKIAAVSSSKASYTDKDVKAGKTYAYKIRAVNSKQAGSYSGALKQRRLTSVSGLSGKNKKQGTLKVTWTKSKKVSGYIVQISNKKSFLGGSSYTLGGKKKGIAIGSLAKGKWYVRIRSYKVSGSLTSYSCWSAAKKLIVKK